MTTSLPDLLPAFHRRLDAERGGILAPLLEVLQREVDILDADIARLYDDWFIETCQPWLVPYIGQLLGVRTLRPVDGVVAPRAYVANTIAYRRRKGTAAVLEQLAADVTGWRAHAVEMFQLLATTQHLSHVRPRAVATPDLRASAPLELIGGPFDTATHTVDVRGIGTGAGDHNLANIALFLWRLQAYPVRGVQARAVTTPADGTYRIDPADRDVPLFNDPEPELSITHLATELDVPGPLRRRALYDETEARRQAEVDGVAPPAGFLGPRAAVEIAVRRTASGPLAVVPPAEILICRLDDWHRPPATKAYRPSAGGPERNRPITVALDPELGRLSFPAGMVPAEVRVSAAYGFSGDLGAGPYDRRNRLPWYDPEERPVTWQLGVSTDPGAVAGDRDRLRGSLDEAIAEWNTHAAANPGSFGLIAVLDSGTHPVTRTVEVPAGTQLAIVAASWPRSAAGPRQVGTFVPSGVRPHLAGTLAVRGTAPAAALNPGDLALDGLLIEGDVQVLAGQLGSLDVAHCTLAPGRILVEASGAVARNGRLHLAVRRVMCGGVRVAGDAPSVELVDTIVSPQAAVAVDVPRAALVLDSVTARGSVTCRTLEASNSILDGPVVAQQTQTGCTRYCYLAPLPATRVPRRHRCQPDLALDGVDDPADQARIRARIVPALTSTDPAQPGYGQLGLTCPPEISAGADDEAEMGAFRFLAQPQRLANLAAVLDEYLPVGLEAGPLPVT